VSLERDGIFSRWMVPALQDILGGKKMPEGSHASKKLRELFGSTNDPVVVFSKERLELGNPNDRLSRDTLEAAMLAFCEDHGQPEGLVKLVWKLLQEKCGLSTVRPTDRNKQTGKKEWLPYVMTGARLKPGVRLSEKWQLEDRDGRRKNRREPWQ
jgi:hypothetical protein